MSIKVVNLFKKYKNYQAIKDVSIDVESGEFLALLGPSGSGKTTLLRIIAGLEQADSGHIYLEGEPAANRPIAERNVGFVFQHYALFRHMTVFDNVAFGLRVRPRRQRPSQEEIYRRVTELLDLVHLEGRHSQYPSELSGGQRQRVALARVLAVEPRVMLLDEPFGALDAKVRKDLRRWLRRLHDDMGITTIFVTHDQEEAMEIADRVAIMNNGIVEQIGTPVDIWNDPVNAFVYDFLGNYNEFLAYREDDGRVALCTDEQVLAIQENSCEEGDSPHSQHWWHSLASWFSGSTGNDKNSAHSENIRHLDEQGRQLVMLFVRPFEVALDDTAGDGAVQAEVVHVNPASALTKVELERPSGQLIQAEIVKEVMDRLSIKKGDLLWVKPKKYRIFPTLKKGKNKQHR